MTQLRSDIYLQYQNLFVSLKDVIIVSEYRVIKSEPDELFIDNVNFFVKSYLISICSYLESYLQDVAFNCAQAISYRIKMAKIPHNFIHWRLDTGIKAKDMSYANIALPVTKKDISDNISANPYKTIKLFQFLGVDLSKIYEFEKNKELINTVVTKRNSIVHHNDRAADISFSDLISYIDVVLEYMGAIDESAFPNRV